MAKFRMPVLIVLGLALALLVWLDNQREDQAANDTSRDSQQTTATKPVEPSKVGTETVTIVQRRNPLAVLQRQQFHDTVARPLFSPTRKPPPKPAQPVAQPNRPQTIRGPNLNEFALLGVVYSEDKTAIALLRETKSGRNFRVEQGDMLGGWQVVKVDATHVKLTKDGVSVDLPLFKK